MNDSNGKINESTDYTDADITIISKNSLVKSLSFVKLTDHDDNKVTKKSSKTRSVATGA